MAIGREGRWLGGTVPWWVRAAYRDSPRRVGAFARGIAWPRPGLWMVAGLCGDAGRGGGVVSEAGVRPVLWGCAWRAPGIYIFTWFIRNCPGI